MGANAGAAPGGWATQCAAVLEERRRYLYERRPIISTERGDVLLAAARRPEANRQTTELVKLAHGVLTDGEDTRR